MKIDATERIEGSLLDARNFDTQFAAAKASGQPFATAVVRNRLAVYFHTVEELAHFATYKDTVTVAPDRIKALEDRITVLERRPP